MSDTAEKRIRPTDQLFYDAFNASPIGIALENIEGQPYFVNPVLCSMLGFSEEELRAKHCVEFSPPEDAAKDWALFEQLRAGSIDHYHLEKRFLRRDGSLIWGRLSISLLNNRESPIVMAMVEDITEKRSAHETLELATRQIAANVIRCSRDFRYLWANQAYADRLQLPMDKIVGQPIVDVVGEETFETLRPHFERVLTGEKVSYEEQVNFRCMGQRWISATYIPTIDAAGVVTGWVGVVVDITERKQTEEVLSNVNKKLIEAQEQECSRLARELHDDINQRLALLAVELEGLVQGLPPSASELARQIEEARSQIVDVSKDVQALSHRLHSSKLQLLGLAAAAASFCKEFSNLHRVEVDFQSEQVPRDLPDDTSLCLYRVLQESLQNAAKHSGSRNFRVSLRADANEIELTVHDSGVGFEPEAVIKGPGFGLTSMKERLKLVDGQLSIDSKRQHGTIIHARVPLKPKVKSASAT